MEFPHLEIHPVSITRLAIGLCSPS